MFNKISNIFLPAIILQCSVLFVSGCAESKQANINSSNKIINTLNNNEENLAEYIIVVSENARLSDAINIFEKYYVKIIKDLKHGRYVIGLKNDPGIKQLKNDIVDSRKIEHIQQNFIYTTQ